MPDYKVAVCVTYSKCHQWSLCHQRNDLRCRFMWNFVWFQYFLCFWFWNHDVVIYLDFTLLQLQTEKMITI